MKLFKKVALLKSKISNYISTCFFLQFFFLNIYHTNEIFVCF